MIKKLLFGMFVLGLVAVPAAGAVYASDNDVKPWESLKQFRGGFEGSAKLEGMEKEEFFALRNQAREAHRAERMLQREERLTEALERGCITEEDLQERLQQRKWRFTN